MNMEEMLSRFAKASKPSPIRELSLLAQASNAVNLAEGFPDFPAPSNFKKAAISAINSDFNQYRHVQEICHRVARNLKEMHGLEVDPLNDIAICCGQTEAFAAAIFAIIDRGDEVILFDPNYETYEASILMAGGTPIFVPLDPPYWTLDREKLLMACTSKTKVIVLNSPHNPTGKVFSMDELEVLAEACNAWDCLAVTDEVYEHVTFDKVKHISLASLPGMQKRTIITSSLSKTYSVTGWRIGWAVAPACIASAIRNIHIRLTDSAPAPFQEAAVEALSSSSEYYVSLKEDYESKRNFIADLLARVGFQIHYKPQGSFFLFAELPEDYPLSDIQFVEELIKQGGVVAVPGCGFFHTKLGAEGLPDPGFEYHRRYVRFAFCKSDATLAVAAERINELVDASGYLNLFLAGKEGCA